MMKFKSQLSCYWMLLLLLLLYSSPRCQSADIDRGVTDNIERQLLPAVLFLFNSFDSNGKGLIGFHAKLVKDIAQRTTVYCLVLEATEEQRADAKMANVVLIEPQYIHKCVNTNPNVDWFLLYKSYFPELETLPHKITHVVGYSPKTEVEAEFIQEEVFPNAQLVLIKDFLRSKNGELQVMYSLQQTMNK
ncbi:uncharacterized protein LOC102809145 [Saccoglossus kowalevskii]|uniref:Uncharacterized protein LOC102809145 n=1 Tax=Saccoglossus kowalevskii TaxID=10224 RepID=A0ABM0MPW8_SACKO|nr:PREDICTED: uncharacterized protein LOC102809145 [Saccoglossus kowalevskii]